MFAESYSFPHPVLGNDDDIAGDFNVSFSINRTAERKIVFDNFRFDVTNAYIQRQINNGDAAYYLRVYCSSTLFTQMIEIDNRVEVHEDDLVNRIEIQVFIVTKDVILNYSDSSFNEQYGQEIFSLDRNEIIGISGKLTIPVPKVNEKLGLGNIFRFNYHSTDKPIEFEYHHDKIFINYPVTDKGEHPPNMLFSTAPWTAFSIFIVPALSDGLRYMEDNPDESDKWEWAMVLDQLLPKENRSGNHFNDAQLVLSGELPVLYAYRELVK